ncbi:MAG: hypothetical protein IJY79_07560 [Clostridia bacterium]|nr:hypothetical protein [Clostridia bacterium]
MSKKLHSKLLSVVLVIAICCATLCGSIIGANAAMADYNGTYTITVGDDKNAVPFGANKVTATVTFELPAGFASGEFTIDTPTQFYSGVSDLKIVDGTVKPIYNGVEFSADNFEDCYLTDGVVSFADYDGYLYTSLTFEYTYNMVSFVTYGASYSYNGTSDYKGTRYPVSITVDGSTFGVDTDYVNASFSVSDTSDEHFHSHHAWYDSTSIANEKTTNGFVEQKDGKHYVSTAVCNYCQYFNSEYHYPQVYPDYTEFDTAVKMYNGAIGWMGISGVTVDYKDNGTLDVNVHVYSQHYSGNAFLLICDENGNELYRTGTVNNGTSNYKDNGFPTDEKCFTLSDFSAQHIDTEWLRTVINLYN